jgi:hypothetical protein
MHGRTNGLELVRIPGGGQPRPPIGDRSRLGRTRQAFDITRWQSGPAFTAVAVPLIRALYPDIAEVADDVVVPHEEGHR